MISLPSGRRWLWPALTLLFILASFRFLWQRPSPKPSQEGGGALLLRQAAWQGRELAYGMVGGILTRGVGVGAGVGMGADVPRFTLLYNNTHTGDRHAHDRLDQVFLSDSEAPNEPSTTADTSPRVSFAPHWHSFSTSSPIPPSDEPHSAGSSVTSSSSFSLPRAHPILATLQTCPNPTAVHPRIQHLRLPNTLHNISMTLPGVAPDMTSRFFNPAILSLPHWSASSSGFGGAKYVLVSRLVTSGFHQESHICLASVCLPAPRAGRGLPADARACTPLEVKAVGAGGGMYCTSPAIKIDIPPTPADFCDGTWSAFPDIPGFHDPRVFWSGKGEPLILVNSASRYGCVGLWVVDLRRLFPELDKLVSREGQSLMSYPRLTEITRNPRSTRASVEKNWLLWFPNRDEAYVQYDLLGRSVPGVDGTNSTTTTARTGGRTFAKLIGNGFTTPNLTDPNEEPCFGPEHETDAMGNHGHWHQGSNALRLILCTRAQARLGSCEEDAAVQDGRSVHFAVMHRKFSNEWGLPLRYERHVVVWESRPPFQMLGVSRWPLLLHEERANPWTEEENWPENNEEAEAKTKTETGNSWWNGSGRTTAFGGGRIIRRSNKTEEEADPESESRPRFLKAEPAYFTYTPSLAWAWTPHSAGLGDENDGQDEVEHMSRLGIGYLGDEVLLGVGMDDTNQAFARVKVEDLLQCLRVCPGVKFAE